MQMYLTVGLPASGKTTFAHEMIQKSDELWIRVNRDDIRRQLYPRPELVMGYAFNPKHEDEVTEEAHANIREAFKNDINVIVDDTNLSKIAINSLTALADEYDADLTIDDSFLNVPLNVLLERNFNRERRVPEAVIHRMWDQAVRPKLKVDNPPTLPWAVIVDVDGTLTLGPHDRSPYDMSKVHQDKPNPFVVRLVNSLPEHFCVIVMTGRDGVAETHTLDWLVENGVRFDEFYIRAEGDIRADYVIKREIYDQFVAGKYYVHGVFDDRLQMVRMWHDMGLNVVRVGNPDASF